MKNRRSFLATVASGGVGLALAKPDSALAQATPSASSQSASPAQLPEPSPSGAASAKAPSADAVAMAVAMRARFDPSLSDDEIQTIAKAIDANNVAAKALNPKKKPLKNGDAPIVRFTVTGGDV
jgi:hypothetical protein